MASRRDQNSHTIGLANTKVENIIVRRVFHRSRHIHDKSKGRTALRKTHSLQLYRWPIKDKLSAQRMVLARDSEQPAADVVLTPMRTALWENTIGRADIISRCSGTRRAKRRVF